MATDLVFTKEDGRYRATYTSAGDTVVQLARVKGGKVDIYAYMEGMTPYPIFRSYSGQDFICRVCVPAGMKVDVESETQVTSGKMLAEE